MSARRLFLNTVFSFACFIFSLPTFAKDLLSLSYVLQNWPQPSKTQPFTETRYDTLLGLTSKYQGAFKFDSQSDILIKYSTPIKGSIELKGQSVTVNFPSKTVSVSLSQLPQVQSFIEPIKALLGGDVEKLTKKNQVTFSSEKSAPTKEANAIPNWSLILTPPGPIVWSAKEIKVNGSVIEGKVEVLAIKLTFANGDWREFRLSGGENAR